MIENNTESRGGWGSRLGYVLSALGMSIGVGAMWRFPMMTAKWGGGSFVLAFALVCLFVVIPAGFAECAFGRKYKKGVIGSFTEVAGTKGRFFGWFTTAVPIGLNFYYPVVMATCLVYIFYTLLGAPYLIDVEGFFNKINDNRPLIFALVVLINAINTFIAMGGVSGGVETACKIMLPLMFVMLVVMTIRVFMLDGIWEGMNFYLAPNLDALKNPDMWMAAVGMALFAVGLGPGYLVTYGSYASNKADVATDFVTLNVTQLLMCVLCGFVTIPAVVMFGLDPTAGKGLVFQSLPLVFNQIPGGLIWFVLFMICMFFAGLSTTLSFYEIGVASLTDALVWPRKKAVFAVAAVSCLGAIPCVWSDTFFMFFDNLIGNVGYCITAAVIAVYLAWVIGAKKIREEWYNPTSVVKYGSWLDYLYKFASCGALVYFAALAVASLF